MQSELSPVEALERFVAENDDLLALEAAIGRFNIFDALGIARAEIRHSNFLAWLLDPSESHGQGDLFLKAILMDVIRHVSPAARPVSPVELDGIELFGVAVRREWPAKIDLCISCREPPFVVAIENKVDSGEHGGQLAKYAAALSEHFPGVKCLRLFLTHSGVEPTDPSWCPYTYSDIHRVLSRVRRTTGGSLGADVGVFLDHYLNLIGSQFMDNPEIVELCQRIYANHRRAIDLINAHAPVAGSESLAPLLEWLQTCDEDWVIRTQNRSYIAFAPKTWVGAIIDPEGMALPSCNCDVYLECESWAREEVRLSVRLVIGPGTDATKRRWLIEQLLSAPYGLSMQRKEPSAKYTRLASKTLAKWTPDEDVPVCKLVTEFSNWLSSLEAILTQIPRLLAMPQ